MFVVFALGLLGASWLNWPVLAGGSFLVGTAAAAWYARPADLLTVVVTPPLLFCVALVGVKAVTASGDMALSVLAGTLITLVGAAPWLLAWHRAEPDHRVVARPSPVCACAEA